MLVLHRKECCGQGKGRATGIQRILKPSLLLEIFLISYRHIKDPTYWGHDLMIGAQAAMERKMTRE